MAIEPCLKERQELKEAENKLDIHIKDPVDWKSDSPLAWEKTRKGLEEEVSLKKQALQECLNKNQ